MNLNTSNMLTYKSPYSEKAEAVYLTRRKYRGGNLRLDLNDAVEHYPYATCTIDFPGALEIDELAIKDYSENEGMLQFLLENDIVHPPHRYVNSGYVKVPVCRLK